MIASSPTFHFRTELLHHELKIEVSARTRAWIFSLYYRQMFNLTLLVHDIYLKLPGDAAVLPSLTILYGVWSHLAPLAHALRRWRTPSKRVYKKKVRSRDGVEEGRRRCCCAVKLSQQKSVIYQ